MKEGGGEGRVSGAVKTERWKCASYIYKSDFFLFLGLAARRRRRQSAGREALRASGTWTDRSAVP